MASVRGQNRGGRPGWPRKGLSLLNSPSPEAPVDESMTPTKPREQLRSIAGTLADGGTPPSLAVRDFLWWWNTTRRSHWVVVEIMAALEGAGLRTEPDFEDAHLDTEITFLPAGTPLRQAVTTTGVAAPPTLPHVVAYADPTNRISKLAAANNRPISVKPNATLAEIVTILMTNAFSQTPVMTTERDVKGIVSWQTIGSQLAMGRVITSASDAMEPAVEIRSTESIFAALPVIVEQQYVLVRAADQRISGIVTTADIGLQFRQLAEPFLLLGEIENHLRKIIDTKFGPEDFAAVRNPGDTNRTIASGTDLTFGEYRVLLEDPSRWKRLAIAFDRVTFVKFLESLRIIRNNVMHFDPDGIEAVDLETLRNGVKVLRMLQTFGSR